MSLSYHKFNILIIIGRILHLVPIDKVMRSGRLRWFEHVQRRDVNNVTGLQIYDGPGNTKRQTTRTGQTWHHRCYPGCGPRLEGVKETKADPEDIGKRPGHQGEQ